MKLCGIHRLVLRSLGEGGKQGVRILPERAPPKLVERILEPWLEDPFPDYHTEPVILSPEALA